MMYLLVFCGGCAVGYYAPWAVRGAMALAKPYVDKLREAGEKPGEKR